MTWVIRRRSQLIPTDRGVLVDPDHRNLEKKMKYYLLQLVTMSYDSHDSPANRGNRGKILGSQTFFSRFAQLSRLTSKCDAI